MKSNTKRNLCGIIYEKGGDRLNFTENMSVDLKVAKKTFSRIAIALIAFLISSYAIVIALELLTVWFLPEGTYTYTVSVLISSISMYLVGVPVFYFIVKGMPKDKGEVGIARPKTLLVLFVITMFFMYSGSLVGITASDILAEKFGIYMAENTLDMVSQIPWYVALVFAVIIGPFFEELIFRKFIIDRTAMYGEKLAILFSALTFAFFHMSVQQFFYAFLVGLVFGYLYTRTRKMKYTYLLHMAVNFVGSVVPLLLNEYAGYEEILTAIAEDPNKALEIVEANPVGYAVVTLYSILYLGVIFVGMMLFFKFIRKIHFNRAPLQLPSDSEATVAFTPVFVIAYFAITVILPFVLSQI